MGRWVLRAHVDDHGLVRAELDVHVTGVEHETLRQAQAGALLDGQLLRARLVQVLQLLEALGGLGHELLVGHRGPGASLNCTGTRPTE